MPHDTIAPLPPLYERQLVDFSVQCCRLSSAETTLPAFNTAGIRPVMECSCPAFLPRRRPFSCCRTPARPLHRHQAMTPVERVRTLEPEPYRAPRTDALRPGSSTKSE